MQLARRTLYSALQVGLVEVQNLKLCSDFAVMCGSRHASRHTGSYNRAIWWMTRKPTKSDTCQYGTILLFLSARRSLHNQFPAIRFGCVPIWQWPELWSRLPNSIHKSNIWGIISRFFFWGGGRGRASPDPSPIGRGDPLPTTYSFRRLQHLDPRGYGARPWPLPFINPGWSSPHLDLVA